MDWDDEFDSGYGDANDTLHRDDSIHDKIDSDRGIDPLNITNPVSAYFFLSDDAQDEISGRRRKNMKCGSCGHSFVGEYYESCPKCYSAATDEVVAGIDDKEENRKCLDCGHTFVGETYESCPECFSPDTEELENEPY